MSTNNLTRIPELDGVRGLAVLLVLMVHIIPYNPVLVDLPFPELIHALSHMGWIGVDVFFVLSGFLITSILLQTRDGDGYYRNFYARRALRIFPLYYLTITIVFIVVIIFSPDQKNEVLYNLPWYYLYVSNWGFSFLYLEDPFAIGLAWSLAIEEQFYLVWPLIVHRLNSRKLVLLSLILIISSLFVRIVLPQLYISPTIDYGELFYHATFTRLDSLILGALIAMMYQLEFWKKLLGILATPTFIISLFAIYYLVSINPISPLWDNPPMYIYGFTFIALAAGGLIVMLTTYPEESLLRKLFRIRLLSFFGKYSYAIYLFHRIPILFLDRYFNENAILGYQGWLLFNVLALLIPVIMAVISWEVFENPILKFKKYFEYQMTTKDLNEKTS
jgi:peptidoglycan/LPS O-acetylase OafA/YrhL